MAGHSKYANTKHRKNAQDARRSNIFSKLNREITIAVREGGPNPDQNPRLRLALQHARGQNMPNLNAERAIRRASGSDSSDSRSGLYEGHGPGGAALIVEVLTDNSNRTASFVRTAFTKAGGSLAKGGSHRHLFVQQGVFECVCDASVLDEVLLVFMEHGLEEYRIAGCSLTLIASREHFGDLATAIDTSGVQLTSGALMYVPSAIRGLGAKPWSALNRLLGVLNANDDVLRVYHNAVDEAIPLE